MKCQHCLGSEANFHYKSNINGEITERHLCADCARTVEHGLFAGALARPMEGFGNLFSGSLLGGKLFGGGGFGLRPSFALPQREAEEVCQSACGSCQTAGPAADAHPSVPLEADEALKQRRAHNALRQEMQTAIEAENFERAAEIRDELQGLERGA